MVQSKCPEEGKCFAKLEHKGATWCGCLAYTNFSKGNGYDGHCPFQKEERSITNNRHYPYINPMLLK